MCVAITMDPGSELALEEAVKMNRTNADGLGVSWIKDGMVQWYKTTRGDLRQLTKLINYHKASPRLVHFRYATVGGTRADLCHPFEVGPLASCKPVDSSSLVMIHNGHWGRWKEVHDLLEKEDLLPDKGPWSDSRLAALMMHQDEDWVHALGGRVATMDGEGTIRRWGDWDALRDGVFVSNKSWDTSFNGYKRGGYTGYRNWKGWDWTAEDWQAFEAEQRALVKLEMAGGVGSAEPDGETCDPGVMYSWGDGNQVRIKEDGEGHGQEQNKVKTQKRARRDTEPVEGPGARVVRRALPAPEGDAENEPTPEGATGGSGQRDGRTISQEPWVHPYTGEVFKARPDGHVVKVASTDSGVPGESAVEAGGDRRGYYSDGEYEDLTRLHDDEPNI